MEGTQIISLRPGMRLGMGISSEVEQVRGQPVEYTTEKPSGSRGQDAHAEFTMITSQHDLARKMGVSVAASINFGLYGGGDARMDLVKEHAAHDMAIHLLLSDTVGQPPRTMADPRLSAAARQVFDRDPDEFRATYGDAYIDEIYGGGQFYGLLVFEAHDQSSHDSLSVELNMHIGNAITGGSLSAEFKNDVTKSQKDSTMSIWVSMSGGSGLQNPTTIDELMALYRNFNAAVAAAPMDYQATIKDIRLLPLPSPPNWVASAVRHDTINTCGARVLDMISLRQEVDFIITNPGQFIDPDIPTLTQARADVESLLPRLAQQSIDCARDVTQCTLAGLDIVTVPLPERIKSLDPLGAKLDDIRKHNEHAAAWFTDAWAPPGGTADYNTDPIRPGGRYVLYRNEQGTPMSGVFWHPDVDGGQAHVVYGAIFGYYLGQGLCQGVIGYPTGDELPAQLADFEFMRSMNLNFPMDLGVDRVSKFEGGSIYWHSADGAVNWVNPNATIDYGNVAGGG